MTDVIDELEVDDSSLMGEEQDERRRRRREALKQELEIAELEQRLAAMRRLRNAGSTLGPGDLASTLGVSGDDAASDVQDARSAVGTPAHSMGGSSPHLREPPIFIGKTLKEARDFIRLLTVNFALLP